MANPTNIIHLLLDIQIIRFWDHVAIAASYEECWPWTRGLCEFGYGTLGIQSIGQIKSHRLAWILTHGPIPDGLCVLHKCDNPPCCNPDHLFVGTRADNTADMVRKGRQGRLRAPRGTYPSRRHGWKGIVPRAKGADHWKAKLTDEQVIEIRRLADSGMTLKAIAPMFNVDFRTISLIKRREIWRHLP